MIYGNPISWLRVYPLPRRRFSSKSFRVMDLPKLARESGGTRALGNFKAEILAFNLRCL